MKVTLNRLRPILSAKASLVAGLTMAMGVANAQNADSLAKAIEGKFTFGGYADSYYQYNFNNPLSQSNLGVGNPLVPAAGNARAFDQKNNQFQIGMIQTKIGYKQRKSEVVADLAFGPHADLGNYGNIIGPLGTTTALAIKQAYFVYNASNKLSFTAGQFGTHIGYEVIESSINYNYSLSNLFNNGPFYHIGAKATYTFSPKVSATAGLVNNIDNLNDNNKQKGIMAQVVVAPMDGMTIYANYLGSDEAPTGSASQALHITDLVVNYQATDQLYLGLNYVEGFSLVKDKDTQYWGGAALYSNFAFTDLFSLGLRAEYFDNTQAVKGLLAADGSGTDVKSLTVTAQYKLADGHLLLKPEFRMDMYKDKHFEDSDGAFTQTSQSTLGLSAIYKF